MSMPTNAAPPTATVGRPQEAQNPIVTGLKVARSATVTSGGPALLALASAAAPTVAARRLPSRIEIPLARRAAWAATAASLAFPALYVLLIRPWLQRWGSTADERASFYPGDETSGPRPLSRTTRAVTVNAPAEHVWQWIAQIGQERGGFYSYDFLENLAGCHLRSADQIHPEWQQVKPGDPIGMTPELSTEVEAVQPGHALVIKHWGSYVVEPLDERRCRVIARSHVDRSLGALPYLLFIELPHGIMERRMLLGVKERAEHAAATA
jgi:hypothetical protein